nr:MAG TPA: hypothetical protein [Caudoviricetes sp.]
MAKSIQEYVDSLYNQGLNNANNLKEQRTQADEAFIKQVQDAIDKSTASAAKPYQTQIEQLPSQYQKLYDTNAVQELVNRRQVQETMANMGLTDSGLNRTQQTAIAIQRGNADAAARLEQQQKTQELQDKIAQLMESGAAQKQQQEAAIRNDSANWYNNLLGDMYNNAVNMGYNQYNTDVAREDENKRWAEQLRQNELDRQAQLDAAKEQAAAAQKQAELEAQQQAFENTMKIVDAMNKADASQEDIYSYLNSTGYVKNGAGENLYLDSGTAGKTYKYAPQPRGNYLLNEMVAGRMTKREVVDDIIKNFNFDANAMKTAAEAAGVTDLLYNKLASTIDTSSLDEKTKYSAQYRGRYLGPKIINGKMTKKEAVADIMNSFKGNDAAMVVAAQEAGVLPELMERYR